MRLCLVCVVATLRRGLVEVHLNLLLAVLWYSILGGDDVSVLIWRSSFSSYCYYPAYSRIEELQQTTLYEVEPPGPGDLAPSTVQYVAVVDPFSTGAVLASVVQKAGYSVIAVYSANLEQLASLVGLVPDCLLYTSPSPRD